MPVSVAAEIEAAVSKGSPEQRTAALRKVAALFVAQSPRLNDDLLGLFDDVIGGLASQISFSARIALSEQIAAASRLPPGLGRGLALDESADVAAPVLRSPGLQDPDVLLEAARTRPDSHLAAIAQRREVGAPVSALIALRGSFRTLRLLAGNAGADLNEDTIKRIAFRAQDGDEQLGQILAARPEIPPALRARIVEEARLHALRQLKADAQMSGLSDGELEESLQGALRRAATSPQPELAGADIGPEFADCQEMQARGQLDEERICAWFGQNDIKRAVAGLAAASGIGPALAVRAYLAAVPDPMMFIVRAAQLNWVTYKGFLQAKSGREVSQAANKAEFDSFQNLSVSTAQRSVRFMSARGRLFTEKDSVPVAPQEVPRIL